MNKFLHIAGLIGLLFTSSCSDFLDEENYTSTAADEYYSTEDGFESLINACYSSTHDIYDPTPYMFCAGTDLFSNAHIESPAGLCSYYTLAPSSDEVEDFFRAIYESVQTCNIALYYADKVEDFDEIELRIGEVTFLRAYYYFLFVQTFGDASLVTEVTDEPITHFERIDVSDVYDFIVTELRRACDMVPEAQNEFGRVTLRAVEHILSKVYLTRAYEDYASSTDFDSAAYYADLVINDEVLSVDYADIFAYSKDNNAEVIFSIQYEGSSANESQHKWCYPWGPLITATNTGITKKNILHPTEYLYTLFGEYDSRFEGTFLNVLTSPYCGWVLDPDNSEVEYYYPRTTAQLTDTANWRLEDPDNRNNAEICPIGESWWEKSNQENIPSLQKWDEIQTTDVQYTHDIFVCRLGEAYLNAAEAYYQLENAAKAAEYINEVRRRAAMSGHESDMAITESDIDIDFILDERARELAGEGHRWFDLKRTGKLMERTKLYNPDIKAYYDSGINPFEGSNGYYKILRPIPTSVITLDDGNYSQNPAYE